jgi:hypothetical protein
MGLLFALQPQPRKSTPDRLNLRSHFRKFAMGGAFLFVAIFLGVMTLAAAPLFKLMQQEGGFWDQIIVGFFVTVLITYPLIAFLCFSFEENVIISRRTDGLFDLERFKKIAFLKWGKASAKGFELNDLKEENWIGAVNAASLKAKAAEKKDRYATKGHWMLTLEKNYQKMTLERRARKEEIDWLKFLIEKHFRGEALPL